MAGTGTKEGGQERPRRGQRGAAATGTREGRLLMGTKGGLETQEVLEVGDGEGHVGSEMLVVEEEVGTAFGEGVVELLGHGGDETCDGVFDVVFLPVHVGVEIDPQLLVQETIGRFDTFLGDHGVEGVNHNLGAKIANSFHLAKLLGNNLFLCITFLVGWDFFVNFAAKNKKHDTATTWILASDWRGHLCGRDGCSDR